MASRWPKGHSPRRSRSPRQRSRGRSDMLLARRRAGTGRAPRTRLTCVNRVGAGLQQVWRGLTAGAVNAGGSAPIRRALHKVAIAALPGRVALAGALAGVGSISNADAMPAALPLAAVCWNRAAAARDEPTLAQEVEVARTVARRQGRTIARQQREHSRACGRERWYRATCSCLPREVLPTFSSSRGEVSLL